MRFLQTNQRELGPDFPKVDEGNFLGDFMRIKIIDKFLSNRDFWKASFICWILLGIIISVFDSSLKYNYIYVICANCLLFGQVKAYESLMRKESTLKVSISDNRVGDTSLFSILNKYGSYLNTRYSIFICFAIGLIYFVSLISLGALTLSKLITIYSGISLVLTVFIAMQLYLKYVLYILSLREISKLDFTPLVSSSSADSSKPDWIVKFTDVMSLFSNYFGMLGITYAMLFHLTTSLSSIDSTSSMDSTYSSIAFLVTWSIVFMFICIGYLVFDYLWNGYTKDILNKLDSDKAV